MFKIITRPLLIIFAVVVLVDIIYREACYTSPSLKCEEGSNITVKGVLTQKNYDETGRVKSIVIGNTLCYVNKMEMLEEPLIGQTVSVFGAIYSFEEERNLGGFNQKRYNESRGIYYYLYGEKIELSDKPKGLKKIRNNFLEARSKLAKRVIKDCDKEAGTINTLLLGDKSGLMEERKELYQAAGVGHFLVISGLHISAIGAFVYELAKRLLRKRIPACITAITFLVMYGLLVGFTVSVLRAVIMYSVRLLSYIFKQSYDLLSAVSLAGIITLIKSPLMVTDSSFVYSYATVIIIGFYSTYFKQVRKQRTTSSERSITITEVISDKIGPLFGIPVVLSVFMLPLSLWFSYSYSVLAIFVNTLLAPLTAPILFLAAMSLIGSGARLSHIAGFFDFLLTLLLRLLDKLCEISIGTNITVISGKPAAFKIILFYCLALGFLFVYRYFEEKKGGNSIIKVIFLSGLICILFGNHLYTPQISMLYVGQGECVILRTGTSSAAIFDMGSTSEKDISKYTVIPFLKASGIKTIDGIYVSHSDADHISGVKDFIISSNTGGINVKSIFLQKLPENSYDDTLLEIINIAKKKGIKVYGLKTGDIVSKRGWTYYCLWPKEITGDSNGDSLTILAEYKNFAGLFTGDITESTEKKILRETNICKKRINLLKIAHHGSKTATSEEFIKETTPDLALISAGINNRYRHPNDETIDVLNRFHIPVYCTKNSGEIDVIIRKKSIRVKEYMVK